MTPEEKKAYDEAVARAKEMLAAHERAAKAAKKDKK